MLEMYDILSSVLEADGDIVAAGQRKSDSTKVLLHLHRDADGRSRPEARALNTYSLLKEIDHPGLARPLGMVDATTISLEYFSGLPLQPLSAHGLPDPKIAIRIALDLANALAAIHSHGIALHTLNPSMIARDSDGGTTRILRLGTPSRLREEHPAIKNTEALQDLPYIAPECIGYMNRIVDYRADFYALGTVFYECLAGHPPFALRDRAELLHCHVARSPRPPHLLNPDIPEALSNVVMRLLAKNAEDRYQSATGLAADLEHCLEELYRGSTIAHFEIARQDVPSHFQLSQQLYGREQELKILRAGIAAAFGGRSHCLLVAGAGGNGKSALVREALRETFDFNAYFVRGKCDQYQRGRPYHVVVEALRQLVRQVLGESENRLVRWRTRLQAALKENGRIMTDLVPELELVIGAQPKVQAPGPVEARNRFNMAFHAFIRAFCEPEHPLILDLDDMHWADTATLQLLGLLLDDPSLSHFCVIAAYRDEELPAESILPETLAKMESGGAKRITILVDVLGEQEVRRFVAAALHHEEPLVAPLASIIRRKTNGNPFFLGQLLHDLYRQGHIRFDIASRRWVWNAAAVEAVDATSNVVALVSNRMKQLPSGEGELLWRTACIGHRFDLATAALACGTTPDALREQLLAIVYAGLIEPLDRATDWLRFAGQPIEAVRFQFVHDRIHQAAYGLSTHEARSELHYSLGRMLLETLSPAQRAEQIFELAGHLNAALPLLTNPAERVAAAELNLAAGRRAMQAAAAESAAVYLRTGLKLLGKEGMRENYALWLEMVANAAEASFLCGDLAHVDELVAEATQHTRSLADQVRVQEVQLQAYIVSNRLEEALSIGLRILASIRHRFPAKPKAVHVLLGLLRTRLGEIGLDPSQVLDQEEAKDEHARAAMRIILRLGAAAYISRPMLHPLLILCLVRLSRRHGHTPETPFSYATYGLLLAAVLGDIPRGVTYGELAIELEDQRIDSVFRGRTRTLVNMFTAHHKNSIPETMDALHQGWFENLANGDLEYAGYAAALYMINGFSSGALLSELAEYGERFAATLGSMQRSSGHYGLALINQAVDNLRRADRGLLPLVGEYYNETRLRPKHEQDNDHTLLSFLHITRLEIACLAGDFELARKEALAAEPHCDGVRSMFISTSHRFYGPLASAVLAGKSSHRGERRSLLRETRRGMRLHREWARHAPANFSHRNLLLDAEYHAATGNQAQAMTGYDAAARQANLNGFFQDEAIALSRAACLHGNHGRERIANLYRQDATQRFLQWGSPWLAARALDRDSQAADIYAALPSRDPKVTAHTLELSTLKSALTDITRETIHSRMLEQMIRAAVQFSGAQNGTLLLRDVNDALFIQAQWDIDSEHPVILQEMPAEQSDQLAPAVINYVRRARQPVVVHDARERQPILPGLEQDSRLRERDVRSILALPLITSSADGLSELSGLLYLENNRAAGTFTESRMEILQIIGLAAAGRLELSRKAATDGLTGLYNHEHFRTLLRKEFVSTRRTSHPLSLVMMDIDHFKRVNDTWGHQAGDEVLRRVAQAIRNCCRESDTLARYGGEELALILPDTNQEGAMKVANIIRSTVEQLSIPFGGEQLAVTISIGVSSIREGMDTPEALIGSADEALYQSKREGRNRCTMGE